MRDLKLVSPHATVSGSVSSVVILDSKFYPNNVVGIDVQEKDANGNRIGPVQNFRGTAFNTGSLTISAMHLAKAHYGEIHGFDSLTSNTFSSGGYSSDGYMFDGYKSDGFKADRTVSAAPLQRNLQLSTPRATSSGTAFGIILVSSIMYPDNIVEVSVQEKDINGSPIGSVRTFNGPASNHTNLYQSANDLVASEYGEVLDLHMDQSSNTNTSKRS
jgi:hypothetical protein